MLHGVRMHPETLPLVFLSLSTGDLSASGKHVKIVLEGSGCLIAPVKICLLAKKLTVTHPCSELVGKILSWEMSFYHDSGSQLLTGT